VAGCLSRSFPLFTLGTTEGSEFSDVVLGMLHMHVYGHFSSSAHFLGWRGRYVLVFWPYERADIHMNRDRTLAPFLCPIGVKRLAMY